MLALPRSLFKYFQHRIACTEICLDSSNFKQFCHQNVIENVCFRTFLLVTSVINQQKFIKIDVKIQPELFVVDFEFVFYSTSVRLIITNNSLIAHYKSVVEFGYLGVDLYHKLPTPTNKP